MSDSVVLSMTGNLSALSFASTFSPLSTPPLQRPDFLVPPLPQPFLKCILFKSGALPFVLVLVRLGGTICKCANLPNVNTFLVFLVSANVVVTSLS